jgi:hypothetical protein
MAFVAVEAQRKDSRCPGYPGCPGCRNLGSNSGFAFLGGVGISSVFGANGRSMQ